MKSWLAAAIVCTSVVSLGAEVGPPTDIATHARGAGKVVVARIADVQSNFTRSRFGDQLIVSHAVLEVLETWKGAPESLTRVTVEGGTVGDLTLRVSDMPELKEGERAVFFLDATADGNVPHGRGRGVMKLDEDDHLEGSQLTLAEVRQRVRAAAQGQGGR